MKAWTHAKSKTIRARIRYASLERFVRMAETCTGEAMPDWQKKLFSDLFSAHKRPRSVRERLADISSRRSWREHMRRQRVRFVQMQEAKTLDPAQTTPMVKALARSWEEATAGRTMTQIVPIT